MYLTLVRVLLLHILHNDSCAAHFEVDVLKNRVGHNLFHLVFLLCTRVCEMAPTDKVSKSAATKAKKVKKSSNYDLGNGIMRYSRSANYSRKALYRFKVAKKPKVRKSVTAIAVVKKIGGANNGGERRVIIKKAKSWYPTKSKVTKRPTKQVFSKHTRFTRKSLTPGRVLILLAGRHKGKRVVLLKVLKTGLLLVNGPFALNACPLRRISQRYVIATQTTLDLQGWTVPEHIDDKYFKRAAKKKPNRSEGDIFAKKKLKYKPSEQRKVDQAAVDKVMMALIKKRTDKKYFFKYIMSGFALKSNQYPHRMRF